MCAEKEPIEVDSIPQPVETVNEPIEKENVEPDPVAVTSAQTILKQMREDSAAEVGPRSQNLGVTIDADGKSNVWAVEPTMAVDEKPQIAKGAIFAAAIAFIAFALLILPRLPLTNADQF